MFKEMRRKEREMTPEAISEVLEKCEYGTLATNNENGFPYAVPISYACVDGKIYIHGARNVGNKVENMERDEKVCFTVTGTTRLVPEAFSTDYESVVVFGTAKEVDGEVKKKGLEALIQKYSKDFKVEGDAYIARAFEKVALYEITPVHVTGKARFR